MKITQQELIEFANENDLQIFGKSTIVISKIRAIQRLVSKGLIPEPKRKGGTPAYWEDDTKIKDRVMWLDEQRKAGKSYKQIYQTLNSSTITSTDDALKEINPILTHIDTLLKIHPTNYDIHYIKAKLYEKVGYYDQALDIFKDILSKNKSDDAFISLLYESIINIYNKENKKDDEKKFCAIYISFAQNKDDNLLGSAYLQMGNYYTDIDAEIARQYYQKAEKLITSKEKLSQLYGSAYEAERYLKNIEKAKDYLHKAIQLFPENSAERALCKANYSVLFFDNEDYDTALEYLMEAKEVFHNHKSILEEAVITNNIGMIYKKKGTYDEALKMFRIAINNLDAKKNPIEYKNELEQLSDVYKHLGNTSKAKFYEEEAKKIQITYLKDVDENKK